MAEHPLQMDLEFILVFRKRCHSKHNVTAQQMNRLNSEQTSLTRDGNTSENIAFAAQKVRDGLQIETRFEKTAPVSQQFLK